MRRCVLWVGRGRTAGPCGLPALRSVPLCWIHACALLHRRAPVPSL